MMATRKHIPGKPAEFRFRDGKGTWYDALGSPIIESKQEWCVCMVERTGIIILKFIMN